MMDRGTIVGNDEDGYYLFSDRGNEVAICYGKGLDKYERAYYGLSFKEENRFFSDRTPGFTIIDNASVEIETANRIIHPISKAEADKRGITHPDSCSVDENFTFPTLTERTAVISISPRSRQLLTTFTRITNMRLFP